VLRNLIQSHVDYTGSPRGQWILENWVEMLPKFVKVFPHEFKRVLGVPRAVEEFKMAPQLAASQKSLSALQGGTH
jgi:glutamate synthase domain-containing protein 3